MGGNAMTTWLGEDGWGWCAMIGHLPVMVVLWGAVVSATVLAVSFASGQRNDPLPTSSVRSIQSQGVTSVRIGENQTDNDEYWPRLT